MDKKSHPSLNLVIEIGRYMLDMQWELQSHVSISSFIRGGYAGEPHPHVIVENKVPYC